MTQATTLYEQLAVWSQVFGSLAFIVALVYVFKRFLTPAVIASQERKNSEFAQAERRRDAVKEEVALMRRGLDEVEEEVKAIRVRATIDARRERERMLADALAEAQRLVRNAEGELERGGLAARELFRARLLDRALTIARSLAAQCIDEATDRELVAGVMHAIDHRPEAIHA